MPTFIHSFSIISELNLRKANNLLIVTASLALAAPSGCFTGIESTPGISKSEVKRQNAAKPTAEQLLIESVGSESFSKWKPGKEFEVTDSKVSMILNPVSESERLGYGSVIRYNHMRPTLTIMGDSVADIIFVAPSGVELTYRTELSPDAVRSSERVYVPFTVERSMVRHADSILAGRKLFLLTPHRHSADGLTPLEARKFVEVTVDSVVAGNSAFPLRVIFTDPEGKQFSTFINPDTPTHTTRAFHRLFSLTDPRKNYPQISDEVWLHIQNGTVAEEMSRFECRLALGQPDEIDRAVGVSNTAERWTYSNGTMLLFEEGVLTKFRI